MARISQIASTGKTPATSRIRSNDSAARARSISPAAISVSRGRNAPIEAGVNTLLTTFRSRV